MRPVLYEAKNTEKKKTIHKNHCRYFEVSQESQNIGFSVIDGCIYYIIAVYTNPIRPKIIMDIHNIYKMMMREKKEEKE